MRLHRGRVTSGWTLFIAAVLLLGGCTDDTTATVGGPSAPAVPVCAQPPCSGAPGTVRWTAPLAPDPVHVTQDGDYRQPAVTGRGSEDEEAPLFQGAGTRSTYVLSLGEEVTAFDAATGKPRWTVHPGRPAVRGVVTTVAVQGTVVLIDVTDEAPTPAAWRKEAVLVQLATGRTLARTDADAYLLLATGSRAVLVTHNSIESVDLNSGHIAWARRSDVDSPPILFGTAGGQVLFSPSAEDGSAARQLLSLDPGDGHTVSTMTLPAGAGVYIVQGWHAVLYLVGSTSAEAIDTARHRTLWTVPIPAGHDASFEVDPADGTAYLDLRAINDSSAANRMIRISRTGEQHPSGQLECQLRSGATVRCGLSIALAGRAQGGPAGAPPSWQSPALPWFVPLGGANEVAGDLDYEPGLVCGQTSSQPLQPSPTGIAVKALAPLVCQRPSLILINR